MDIIQICFLTFLWSVLIILATVLLSFLKISSLMRNKKSNILYVISHPDDECMFFAPSILKLSSKHSIYLLCLSNGDYYSNGIIREKELLRSCSLLNINRTRIKIINHKDLPDHPLKVWDDELVATLVEDHVKKWNISTVITFDEYGVSGHSNHKATFSGIRKLFESNSTKLDVFTLTSHNVLRKYSSIFDVVFTLLTKGKHVFLSNLYQFNLAQRAMLSYKSQMVWFRYLYITCSRYMILNDLKKMQ